VYITVELKAYNNIRHKGKLGIAVSLFQWFFYVFYDIVIVIMFTYHIYMSLLSNKPLVVYYF
jgi:hypothetical protein